MSGFGFIAPVLFVPCKQLRICLSLLLFLVIVYVQFDNRVCHQIISRGKRWCNFPFGNVST